MLINWLLTIGVLVIFALIFAGVNIVGVLLFLAIVVSLGNVILQSIEERKKKKAKKDYSNE